MRRSSKLRRDTQPLRRAGRTNTSSVEGREKIYDFQQGHLHYENLF